MAKITIKTQLLTGNMGDMNPEETAERFAAFLRQTWFNDLAAAHITAQGHIIRIDVDVSDATGCGREMSVEVDCGDDGTKAWALQRRVERALTPESLAWDNFCNE